MGKSEVRKAWLLVITVVLPAFADQVVAPQSDGQRLLGYARAVVKAESLKIDTTASAEDVAAFDAAIKTRLGRLGASLDKNMVANATREPKATVLLEAAQTQGDPTAIALMQIRDALLRGPQPAGLAFPLCLISPRGCK